MKRTIAAAAVIGVAVLLAGCGGGESASSDRPDSDGGKNPDATKSATQVTVYLNADKVPNVAMFCADGLRFASTLSGSDSGANKPAVIVRIPERDALCGKAR